METPRRVEHQQTDRGYVPVYTTGVVAQPWETYTAEDHRTWATLFERQQQLLVDRAAPEFLAAIGDLRMSAQEIPKFSELNVLLAKATGWTLVGSMAVNNASGTFTARRTAANTWTLYRTA